MQTSKQESSMWIDKLFEMSGIPKRFLNAELKDFAQKYNITSDDHGLYIHGERGVGKTHLLSAICKFKIIEHLKTFNDIEPKYIPAFISTPELLFLFKKSYSKTSKITEDEVLKKYTKAKILFLDDIGAERSTDWSVSLLYLIIDRRYSEMKQTFISSNLALDKIASQLDDRIASRIAGMCEVVEIVGKDKRLK